MYVMSLTFSLVLQRSSELNRGDFGDAGCRPDETSSTVSRTQYDVMWSSRLSSFFFASENDEEGKADTRKAGVRVERERKWKLT